MNSGFTLTRRPTPQNSTSIHPSLKHSLMLSNFTDWVILSVSVVCLDTNPRDCWNAPKAKWTSCFRAARYVLWYLPLFIIGLIDIDSCRISSKWYGHNVVFRWSATLPHVSMCLYEHRQFVEPQPQSYWPALKHICGGGNYTREGYNLVISLLCIQPELGCLLSRLSSPPDILGCRSFHMKSRRSCSSPSLCGWYSSDQLS